VPDDMGNGTAADIVARARCRIGEFSNEIKSAIVPDRQTSGNPLISQTAVSRAKGAGTAGSGAVLKRVYF
jgi:hypothetical protein